MTQSQRGFIISDSRLFQQDDNCVFNCYFNEVIMMNVNVTLNPLNSFIPIVRQCMTHFTAHASPVNLRAQRCFSSVVAFYTLTAIHDAHLSNRLWHRSTLATLPKCCPTGINSRVNSL